jgi:hypothetical protein
MVVNKLTLALAIWSVLVTVSGVVIAVEWPYRRLVVASYGVVSLGVPILALLVFPDPVRRAMQWLIRRGEHTEDVG